ncbi:MAG: hypothetical protein K0R00_3973 [Herbinix sp.]|jgi:hypothetical protein|nr:hypothetical protein [Herbinix sp.]
MIIGMRYIICKPVVNIGNLLYNIVIVIGEENSRFSFDD